MLRFQFVSLHSTYTCHRYINRGFLNGPYCPIYGFGALAFIFTTNGFINLAKLLKDAYSRIGWELNNPNLPIMFIAGTKDPVIINESAWFNSITFLREIGYTNIKHKLYQGDRHEVLNDKHRDEVLEDLLNFLTETE